MFSVRLDIEEQALIRASATSTPDEYLLDVLDSQLMAACALVQDADVAKFVLVCGAVNPRLQLGAVRLEAVVESVQARGTGASEFLFVKSHGRACEVSLGDGGFWLEFWESSTDDDAAPVREATLQSEDEVIASVVQWLVGPRGRT